MTDKTEANRQVALRVVNAVGCGDKETVASLLHPELDWWLNGIGHLNREEFMGSLDMLASAKVTGWQSRWLAVLNMRMAGSMKITIAS